MTEVNEKKLLQKFLTIKATLNVLVGEVEETVKMLSHVPAPRKKKGGLTDEEVVTLLAKKNKRRQHYTIK